MLYAVARKNAKSTLSAAILLCAFCLERQNGPQVVSAATTGDQARVVWGIAKRMVERNSELRQAFTLECFANAIARYEVGGTFRPINAKASTQDGLNPSALCFDELHAHKTRDLFDVLRSAVGSRRNPLYIYSTTEGYENPGPWHEVRRFAFQLLEGLFEADHFLAIYYALDDAEVSADGDVIRPADDDFDESKWIKASPMLGVSVLLSKMRELASEAKMLPGQLAEFQIKRLNRRAASASAWVNLPKWLRCGKPVDPGELVAAGWRCWGGLDLASVTDLAALFWLWEKGGQFATWGHFWAPAGAVKLRSERGSVPYSSWVQQGFITQTEGDVIDYAIIKATVLAEVERFHPVELAYDRWNASQLVIELGSAGVPLVEFAQGAKSFHPAMQALEQAYVAAKFAHGGNPVLNWNVANLVPRYDGNMNMAPDRKRSPEKIDGIVAVLMAMGRAAAHVNAASFWEQ
jgi:phage terminase large subunit-like protein